MSENEKTNPFPFGIREVKSSHFSPDQVGMLENTDIDNWIIFMFEIVKGKIIKCKIILKT